MARSSRLSVCLAIVMRNSSKIHCARSISRQRTTPCTAVIGPLSIMPAVADCSVLAGAGRLLGAVELARLSCGLAIEETVRTGGVEAKHRGQDGLKSDTADLGRLGARCPIVDSREC